MRDEKPFFIEGEQPEHWLMWAFPPVFEDISHYVGMSQHAEQRTTADVIYWYIFRDCAPSREVIDRLHNKVILKECTYNGTWE